MKNPLSNLCNTTIIMLCIISLTITSCKKGSSSSPNNDTSVNKNNNPNDTLAFNTIQATINDTLYTFNVGTKDTSFIKVGSTVREVSGWDSDIDNSNSIAIDFVTPGKTKADTATYTEASTTKEIEIFFATQGATIYYQDAFSKSNPNIVKGVITAVSDTSIQGTFTGDIYFNGDKTLDKKSVTNGRFSFTK